MSAGVTSRKKPPVHRASILRLWAFYYFVVAVGVPLVLWLMGSGLLIGGALLRHLAASMFLALGAAALVAVLITVEVRPEGIRGQNFWSLPVLARWDEMGHAAAFRVLGINGLRVDRGTGKPALYLPLFLKDMPTVVREIADAAPPDNVLRRFFRV